MLIPIIIAGVIFWRFYFGQKLESPKTEESIITSEPVEVPKRFSGVASEGEETNVDPSPTSSPTQTDSPLDERLKDVEASVKDLKVRISSLEKASYTTPSTSTAKAPVYIPLGSNGEVADTNWTNLNSFQASIDPAQYSGYTSMQLQVTMRLNQPGGTAYARLYNSSNSSATSSEPSTTQTSSTLVTSSGFTLPGGAKTYILQAKSSDGSQLFIDNATIKVNF